MSKIRKDVGVKIIFDDEDYSVEESLLLYKRFFQVLSKIKGSHIPDKYITTLFKPIIEGHRKK